MENTVLDFNELESGFNKIDTAITANNSLESIAENINTLIEENDGITEEQLDLVQASVESILSIANIGIKVKDTKLPTLESYSTLNNKEIGNITLEGIVDTAKKIWDSIIDAIKKAIEWVRNIFNKIFGRVEKQKEKIEEHKEKVEELIKINPVVLETEFENEELFKKLYVDGDVCTVEDVEYTVGLIRSIFNNQKDVIDASHDLIKNIDNHEKAQTVIGDMLEKSLHGVSFTTDTSRRKKYSQIDTDVVLVSKPLVGNKELVIIAPNTESVTSSKQAKKAYARQDVLLGKIVDEIKVKPIKVLTLDENIKMTDSLIKIIVSVQMYEEQINDLDRKKNAVLDKLKDVLKTKNKEYSGSDSEINALIRALGSHMTKLPAMATQLVAINEPISKYMTESAKRFPGDVEDVEDDEEDKKEDKKE